MFWFAHANSTGGARVERGLQARLALAVACTAAAFGCARAPVIPHYEQIGSRSASFHSKNRMVAECVEQAGLLRFVSEASQADFVIDCSSDYTADKKVHIGNMLLFNLFTIWTGYVYPRYAYSLELAFEAVVRDRTGAALMRYEGRWSRRRLGFGQHLPPMRGQFEGLFLRMKQELDREAALGLSAHLDRSRAELEASLNAPEGPSAAREDAGSGDVIRPRAIGADHKTQPEVHRED